MLPLRFHYLCGVKPPAVLAGGNGVVIACWQKCEHVLALAEQYRLDDPDHTGSFSPAGLLTELKGRPGRSVSAWLAWPIAPCADNTFNRTTAGCPLGLVALVEAGSTPILRFSIAWLLVHPRSRRRGVGRALVAKAVAHAESRAATVVFAETHASWTAAPAFWRAVGFEQIT